MNVAFDPKLIDHLELREKALKERDARALYQMAQIYASMKGKKNEKKAYELYKSSATHGYAKARFMMGLCNEKGIGVKQSLPMAITWYIPGNRHWKALLDSDPFLVAQPHHESCFGISVCCRTLV